MTTPSGLNLKLMDNLKLFKDRIKEERAVRVKQGAQCLSFGVPFLDEALAGIYSNDLIIFGAKSGLGKTQLATLTAMTNVAAGKRVHYFALEAETHEIERRIKYQILAECFFKTLRKEFPGLYLNYLDWYYGRLDGSLGKIEPEIEATLAEMYPSLFTEYRTGDFTVQDFERKLLAIQDQTDLVIVDHLHYFDSDDENENRAMKNIVKKIRDVALLVGKPVILIAHLRKSDRKVKQICPGLDEFHGSSDITKIATKVITLASCTNEQSAKNQWPTYFRIPKCRTDGSRTRYVGLLGFNSDTSRYQSEYYLGKLSPSEDEFQSIQILDELPYWAKTAQLFPQRTGSVGVARSTNGFDFTEKKRNHYEQK